MFPLLTSGHPVNLFDELYSVRGFVEQNYTMRVINLKKLAYAGVLHYLLMRISVGFIISHFRKKLIIIVLKRTLSLSPMICILLLGIKTNRPMMAIMINYKAYFGRRPSK